MFKRHEERDNDYTIPPKRPKIKEIGESSSTFQVRKRGILTKKNARSDDIWGDDFGEEEIEEMDFIASQACLQDTDELEGHISPNLKRHSYGLLNDEIAPILNNTHTSLNVMQSSIKNVYQGRPDLNQMKESSQHMNQERTTCEINYTDFETKLVNKKNFNSTFRPGENLLFSDNTQVDELIKLKLENKKLLNDFITKDGETAFLRTQLQQTQLRADNEKLEKVRFIEEQENRHRSEINAICKEKENLKTQLDLQALEIGNLMERCKILEAGNVRLTEPRTANASFHTVRSNKSNSIINRISRSVEVKESCMQTNIPNKSTYVLKTSKNYYPLSKIPKTIFGASAMEKSVVDIQVIEKTGRRNLPILQEEETFRIFENPDLVKPIVTMIDGERLSAKFILSELVAIERKTDVEINSEHTIPIINKIISCMRELMLNTIVVLKTIFQAMKNDDIRDMNDVYFSEVYEIPYFHAKSTCDSNAWHKDERAIETRRVIGVLAYISSESCYLSNYIAGKTKLLTEGDKCYKNYISQMERYNAWPKKDHDFEALEMILEFLTLVGLVRRAHQFSGLICAIITVVCSVQKKVGYCSKGMDYVFRIFKEIVFSRPLSLCFLPVTEMMATFSKCTMFFKNLCTNSQTMAVNNWKGVLHFTPDACPLQVFMVQIENFKLNVIMTVEVTHALISFMQIALQTHGIPLRTENSNSCNCYMKILRFTIKMLYTCSKTCLYVSQNTTINDLFLIKGRENCTNKRKITCDLKQYEKYFETMDEGYLDTIQRKQLNTLREGINFLSHLVLCDPDFVIRLSDIEDSFHLFMKNIEDFDNLILHENEKEALNRIKSSFIVDRVPQLENQSGITNFTSDQLNIMNNFEKEINNFTPGKRNTQNQNLDRTFAVIKSLYNLKVE